MAIRVEDDQKRALFPFIRGCNFSASFRGAIEIHTLTPHSAFQLRAYIYLSEAAGRLAATTMASNMDAPHQSIPPLMLVLMT